MSETKSETKLSEDTSKFPTRYPGGVVNNWVKISNREEIRRRASDGAIMVWRNIQFVESTEWTLVKIREGNN